ncbi:protein ZNRD2 [Strix uralensis]|uniref:protein ZNRD2 n=1 Tax=Strix uralensis TaxID=36305 RepID=UPI003DA275AF
MGQLLLRGYRMLGRCCPHCGTILLQDKQQQLHCVACQELDCDGEGGGPAPAAPRPPSPPPPPASRPPPVPSTAREQPRGYGGRPPARRPPRAPPRPRRVAAARAAVLHKLGWAARELPRTASAEGSAQLCALVRACADALGGLQALAPPAPPPP